MRPFWVSLGLRELRGGLAGFRVFLACLILGVGGIAIVGSVTAAIERGLGAEGREVLGGDFSVAFSYRFADAEERAWLAARGAVSEVVDLRSMLGTEGEAAERALTQVKGIDGAYPLAGTVTLAGGGPLGAALAARDGVYGLVTEPVLAERLGLSPGDRVRLAGAEFEFRAVLEMEPDRASGGFALGPRVMVLTEGLRAAGMMGSGTLFTALYRVRLAGAANLDTMKDAFTARFPDSGGRWRDRRNAAPGVQRFVTRLGAFLTLTGLAALAIGGVGVGAAVRGYLDRKTRTIAALRTIGAGAGDIFAAYSLQIAVIAGLGIAGAGGAGSGRPAARPGGVFDPPPAIGARRALWGADLGAVRVVAAGPAARGAPGGSVPRDWRGSHGLAPAWDAGGIEPDRAGAGCCGDRSVGCA
jgi:putative ABC transport system permease protein